MNEKPTRRRVLQLSSLLTALSSGCLGFMDNSRIQDVTLFNARDKERTVTTTIIRSSDGERILSDTVTIKPDGDQYYDDPITEEGQYRIGVAVENGSENSYEWDAPESETAGIQISIDEDGIGFSPVVT